MTAGDFETLATAARAESAAPAELDGWPFGVIRLDREGHVLFHSQSEKRLSGFGDREVLGRDFFTSIAPCMNNPMFRGRIAQAQRAGAFAMEFSYVGDFADASRPLQVRIESASDGGLWIFMKRPDGVG